MLIPPIVTDPQTGTPSDVIRLGPDVRGHIYYSDGKGGWRLSDNTVNIPEGWYALPPSPTGDSK